MNNCYMSLPQTERQKDIQKDIKTERHKDRKT
jgi:hypothetical protein